MASVLGTLVRLQKWKSIQRVNRIRCFSSSPPDPQSAYPDREKAPERVESSSPGYRDELLWTAEEILLLYDSSKKAIEGRSFH